MATETAIIYRNEEEVLRLDGPSRAEVLTRIAEEYILDVLEEDGYELFLPRKLEKLYADIENHLYDRAVERYFAGVPMERMEWLGEDPFEGFIAPSGVADDE